MIHPRIILVTAEVVATMRGLTCEAVYNQVDTDTGWQWVWNVGGGRERSLRFWSKEQNFPEATRNLRLEEVIGQLVPRRELSGGFQKWEVAELLRVSRRQLMDLEMPFVPRHGGMWIPAEELKNFFRRRWCYAAPSPLRGEGRGEVSRTK